MQGTNLKAHPWEEPRAPRSPQADRLFRWGLTAPDVTSNPRLWPLRWIYGQRALARLKGLAQNSRRILDIRCGSGWLLWELAKVSPQAHLLGLDTRLRPLMWGQLQSEVRLGGSMGQVQLQEGHILDFVGEPQSYDLILCNLALSQEPDVVPIFEKLQGLLAPRGILYYYEACEPSSLTVENLARYLQRRRAWSGIASDLWNLRREVRASFAKDSLRSLRHPQACSEEEIFAGLQGSFEVVEQGRLRALTDLWLPHIPSRLPWLGLGLLLGLDRLAVAWGWLEGCRRYALARKINL